MIVKTNNTIADESAYFHVDPEFARYVKKYMVSSPAHLKRSLNLLFPYPENNTIHYIYRSYIWLAFSGVPSKDAMLVREEDVSFDSMEIMVGDIAYPIYAEAMEDLHYAKTANIMVRTPDKMKDGRKVSAQTMSRQFGTVILRGFEKTFNGVTTEDKATIQNNMSAALERAAQRASEWKSPQELGDYCTTFRYRYIMESGRLYRAYVGETLTGTPTGLQMTSRNKIAIPDRRKYDTWKVVFDL